MSVEQGIKVSEPESQSTEGEIHGLDGDSKAGCKQYII